MMAKHLVTAGLCDNGGGPDRCANTDQGLTTQLKPDWRRAVMAVAKSTRKISRRLARRIAQVLPLDQFPEWKQQEIAAAVAAPKPPPKWRHYGPFDSPYPLCAMVSRGWYEWYWQRGIDPEVQRPPIPFRIRTAVIARDGYVCQLCGSPVQPSDVHLDHVIPYSKGGPDTVANLQVAHSLCNILKGSGD